MDFFDTNILVYAVDPKEPVRREQARALLKTSMDRRTFVVSTQVMLEFRAAVLRRNIMTTSESADFLRQIGNEHILSTGADDVWHAFEMQERFGFAIWDAMMVHSAVESGCEVLYSEDMQHGQQIGPVRIVNPFRHEVHEPAPAYEVKREKAAKTGTRTLRR